MSSPPRRATISRYPSYSKRTASLHSPRQVPLPATDGMDAIEPTSCDHHPTPQSTTWIDRNSSASLPLPFQVAFYSLPGNQKDSEPSDSSSGSESPREEEEEEEEPEQQQQRSPTPPCRPTTPPYNDHFPEFTAMRPFMTLSQQRSSLPPPDPPVILPPPSNTSPSRSSRSSSAPYLPFLSPSPAPPDCHLEIHSQSHQYTLNVSLPGFARESITLATKRRRILHVVADNWGEGGGHFERRIAFGYDADLIHVRAEFDGSLLKIRIPRRDVAIFD